ncbi:hypothetical protein TELCIR_21898, partial [Teladorsagia circumcincta]
GDFASLAPKVQRFVAEKAELMNPAGIYICDGSQKEFDDIVDKLVERGVLTPLKAYENKSLTGGTWSKALSAEFLTRNVALSSSSPGEDIFDDNRRQAKRER